MDGTTGEIDAPESSLRLKARVAQNRRSESQLRTHQIDPSETFPPHRPPMTASTQRKF
jgi:hypothetical protein